MCHPCICTYMYIYKHTYGDQGSLNLLPPPSPISRRENPPNPLPHTNFQWYQCSNARWLCGTSVFTAIDITSIRVRSLFHQPETSVNDQRLVVQDYCNWSPISDYGENSCWTLIGFTWVRPWWVISARVRMCPYLHDLKVRKYILSAKRDFPKCKMTLYIQQQTKSTLHILYAQLNTLQ